jgi:hypothetical protein
LWHFNSFSGTQLIFSQTSPSAAFLWVPFLSPPKEMERKPCNALIISNWSKISTGSKHKQIPPFGRNDEADGEKKREKKQKKEDHLVLFSVMQIA